MDTRNFFLALYFRFYIKIKIEVGFENIRMRENVN